ncbi:MAG: pantetheine-phosphate adenylyltransferase [Bacteroidales bacterium]|nr:pantetheine-phosphate adenylyltransferase [Bacteroidales bacterium]MBQ2913790.1 pantetheine-phosphate adenylyltransferase [Bacteroidales bacterium]MBQ7018692.1 pantetheine-phosphate adenylyltransferase [Bacteroidales bacterium]MBR2478511.1 pantetheine-phosphate adenylyltransferase [Bacteroidales bacterium]
MRTAVFPGSFDPFTVGHFDVLESALQLFDKVIIAVGYNSSKTGFFSPDTRVEIIRQATAHMDNVEVCTYTGLTIDLCHQLGVNNIIRGLRTTTDFEMESVIAQANKKMAPDVSTVFIPACQEYSFISSTVVRDILIHKGNAAQFLPKGVTIEKFLAERK